jgi:hypothetical protein
MTQTERGTASVRSRDPIDNVPIDDDRLATESRTPAVDVRSS